MLLVASRYESVVDGDLVEVFVPPASNQGTLWIWLLLLLLIHAWLSLKGNVFKSCFCISVGSASINRSYTDNMPQSYEKPTFQRQQNCYSWFVTSLSGALLKPAKKMFCEATAWGFFWKVVVEHWKNTTLAGKKNWPKRLLFGLLKIDGGLNIAKNIAKYIAALPRRGHIYSSRPNVFLKYANICGSATVKTCNRSGLTNTSIFSTIRVSRRTDNIL